MIFILVQVNCLMMEIIGDCTLEGGGNIRQLLGKSLWSESRSDVGVYEIYRLWLLITYHIARNLTNNNFKLPN